MFDQSMTFWLESPVENYPHLFQVTKVKMLQLIYLGLLDGLLVQTCLCSKLLILAVKWLACEKLHLESEEQENRKFFLPLKTCSCKCSREHLISFYLSIAPADLNKQVIICSRVIFSGGLPYQEDELEVDLRVETLIKICSLIENTLKQKQTQIEYRKLVEKKEKQFIYCFKTHSFSEKT